jgi:hypothetical protein
VEIMNYSIIGSRATGRDGLFGLVRSLPENMRYENGPIVAEGDYVFVQGRFSNIGAPSALITVDIVRMENGKVAEHWDVWQDEATKASSQERATDVRRPLSRLIHPGRAPGGGQWPDPRPFRPCPERDIHCNRSKPRAHKHS